MFKSSRSQQSGVSRWSRVLEMAAAMLVLLLMIGCQAAPVPPPPPAPPTPVSEPTSIPVVPAQMEDLVGWWKVSNSMFASIHVEPDGTTNMFGLGTDTTPSSQISGPTYRGSWRPKEGAWEKRTLFGVGGAECVGQYDVEVLSADSLHFVQIVDSCGQGHEDEVWTRASKLEPMFCTWIAQGEQDGMLALRSDMSYAAWHGASPESGSVIWGKGLWNDMLGQIELRDSGASPCGPSKVGTYKLVIADDGSATFECIEDLCEQRRKVMTQWGPFQRSDIYAEIAGRYQGVEQPQYELLLSGCGMQRLRSLPDFGELPLHEGSFTVQGSQLQFLDARGGNRCEPEPGTWAYTLVDDKLTIEVVEDPCQARKDVFAACATWTRVGDR